MQQNSITILSTQHLQPILLTEAAKKNVVIETIPFIETEAIIDQRIKTKITDLAKAANIIVFTSRNAVEAVTSYLQGTIPGWKIFCIGSATKKSASGYFGKNAILATAGSAGNLADVIVNKKEVSSITFFCGNQRRAELPEKLKQNGIEVTEIVVYKTLALTQKILKNYDAILFYSPSAVNSFFEKNNPGPQTILFAIGNTTTKEIKKYTNNKIVVADKPSKKLLAEQAINYFINCPFHR